MSVKNYLAFACLFAVLAARATTLTYTGANKGDWNTPSNWDGTAVPTIDDDVIINAKWVWSATSISAKSITISGNGSNAGLVIGGKNMTKDDVQKQVPYDDTATTTITMTVVNDVSLSNAHLSLGGRRSLAKRVDTIGATIGGNFTLSGGAIAVFYAGETAGMDIFDQTASAARLYANANVVTIGGALSVGASSFLYVENDGLTGTPVFFRPATLNVASGGTISASARGWNKYNYTAAPYPVATISDANSYNGLTYAFAPGFTYATCPAHGGLGSKTKNTLSLRYVTASDGTYVSTNFMQATYGNAEAPFLPGSPGGFQWSDGCRGGGSVCVFASGAVTISGTVEANGSKGRTPGSGGSVWISGVTVDVDPDATVSASGGNDTDGRTLAAGGGRISISGGLSQAQIDALASGATATSLGLGSSTLSDAMFNVFGGINGDGVTYASSGTATILLNSSIVLPVSVTATPALYSASTPSYGFHIIARADLPTTATIAEATTYPAFYRGYRRYTHSGYTATDSNGDGVSDISAATKHVTVVWNWATIEDRVRIRPVGGGTITVNGVDYAADADIWVAPNAALSVSATDGAGAFTAWYGDFAGGKSMAAKLSLTAMPGMTIYGVFSDATGTAKSYVGANDGFWDVDANWSPAGAPSPLDDVTISSKQVKSYGVAVAKSLTLSAGKLAVGGASAATTTAQTAPTDADIFGFGLVLSGDFTATGASAFSLGARRPSAKIFASSIGGNLSLAGTSTFAAYAEPYNGALNASGKIDLPSYADAATAITVGGAMTLSDSAVIYPENDVMTGTAIRFDVAGDVEIGSSASVDASNRGWGWTKKTDYGGIVDSRSIQTEGTYFTFAPGYGSSWGTGGAYGGTGTAAVNGKPSGAAYGYKYAPYLCGSPCGAYSGTTVTWRPGGTVWIKTPGAMTVNGIVKANSTMGSSTGGRSSAGGVWLVCGEFTAGANASLEARATQNVAGSQAPGTGGRVSIAIGVSDTDLSALAAGEEPNGLSYSDEITVISAFATGGHYIANSITYPSVDGTLTTVMGAMSSYPLTVASVPAGVYAEGLDYSVVNVTVGEPYAVTAPACAFDSAHSNMVRYACAGWVVSNATAEVASGVGTTASFTPETGPFFLTWLWNGRENIAAIEANDATLGAVSANGGVAGATATVWTDMSGSVSIAATPEEGAEFLYWVGDVPFGKARDNPLVFATAKPRRLTAVFRVAEAPMVRTWVGGDKQREWLNTNYWSPANLPGLADDVVISAGTVDVSNRIEVASLIVCGSAIVRIAAKPHPGQLNPKAIGISSIRGFNDTYQLYPYKDTFLDEIAIVTTGDFIVSNSAQVVLGAINQGYSAVVDVGGDMRLKDNAQFAIFATATNDTFTVASGTSWLTVDGVLSLEDSSIFYTRCEQYTGAGVILRPNTLRVAEGATLDASGAGFSWIGTRTPASDAPLSSHGGSSHNTAGGYGGRGSGADYSLPDNWGLTYGNEYAPTLPGTFGSFYSESYTGGGLLRIHANRAAIAGTLDASAYDSTHYSGGAGGGIWLTASKTLDVAATAAFIVHGGRSSHEGGGLGGGGRIAIGVRLSEAQIAQLATSGSFEDMAKRDATTEWRAENPLVTIDLSPGKKFDGSNPPIEANRPELYGTFRYLANPPSGLAIHLK